MFYVLRGELTFRCGEQSFEVSDGGFIYLPPGVTHGYTIRSEEAVRLLAVTFAPRLTSDEGWGGFIGDVEREGKLIANVP